MKNTPYENLLNRCESIPGKQVREIFLESGVDPACIYHWKKREILPLRKRSLALILASQISNRTYNPDLTTYDNILHITGSEKLTEEIFRQAGFSNSMRRLWKVNGDPVCVTNYKKVEKVVQEYEKIIEHENNYKL